ncbi:MAG: ArsR family transcriptional regulator [Candidatus Altiarchaeota archaeon]|nr:ArsR family transcriptional regulator [Candidatus Altiarchaeota archaeon]
MVVRVRVIRHRKPIENTLDDELEWLCSSLGFCEPIDRDKTAIAIFKKLMESSHHGEPLRSDDISEGIGKSRGAVVNHLNKLISSGLVVRKKNRYELREQTLEQTIRELRRDMERMLDDMEETAKEIDKRFRL